MKTDSNTSIKEKTRLSYYVHGIMCRMNKLGEEEGGLFCRVYSVNEGGNYREEASGNATGAGAYLAVEDEVPVAAGDTGSSADERRI